jgi:hypothetical protein
MEITPASVLQDRMESLRRPLFPAIRWGAILAGVVVGIAVQLALTLLGLATGLSNVAAGTPESRPLLWAAFGMLIAAFVSGYIAARMSGLKRRADGMLHGAVSWAVTTILFAMFATAGGGGLMSGVLVGMTQPQNGNGEATAPSASEPPVAMDEQALQRFQSAIRLGDRETAIMILMTSTDMDRVRAENLVDQALALSGNGGSASGSSGGASSMRGSGAMDASAWIVFAAVALALVSGIAGGATGAAGSRRRVWSEQSVRSAYVAAAGDSDGNEDPGA